MFDFSPIQIIIVLVIALLVFGPKRLPEMGKSLGRGLREFKHSISGFGDDEPEAPAATAPMATAAPPANPSGAPARGADVDDEEDEVLRGIVVSGAEPPAGTSERQPQ